MVEESAAASESVSQAWLDVLGHLHPLIVHFPIALAVVAALAVLWNWIRRHDGFGEFAFHCVWIAAAASVVVAASGWFFAEEDAKETQELFLHRWFGIGSSAALVLLAMTTSFVRTESRPRLLQLSRLGVLLAAIGIGFTAHFGGEMVWGDDQLSKPLSEAISLSWRNLRGRSEEAASSSANSSLQDKAATPTAPASNAVANPTSDPEEKPEAQTPAKNDEPGPPMLMSQNDIVSIENSMDGTTPPSTPPASPANPKTDPGLKTPSAPSKDLDYNKDIRPIFEARCWECHGKGQSKGGVAFDHVGELIVKDKKKGIIVASKPDASTLMKVIKRSATTKGHMPPKGERLSPEQIALIEAWIQQGAKVTD